MSFYVVEPIPITDTILTGTNVPEADVQEFDTGTAYAVGDTVMVATSTANIHKTYECLVAQSAGLTADILDEDCSDLTGWTDIDAVNGVSEVSPIGQWRLDANTHGASNRSARKQTISAPPNTFSLEMKTYFDSLGTSANSDLLSIYYITTTWKFLAYFCSDGLLIVKSGGATTEVGTNIVKCNANAAWQTWRFQVTKTVEADATVEVFLKEEGGEWASQGTVDCDYTGSFSPSGEINIGQYGYITDNMVSHIDYIKIATGLGEIERTNNSPVGNSDWLETGSTNRWNCFNDVLGSQTSQATKIEYVLTPGAVIDSVALLNLDSDTVDLVLIDSADDLVTNGQSFTGATGTTQPTSWDKVKTPAAYLIDSGAIKITTNDTAEGMSQTIAVSPATEYQLVFLYKNTSGDTAQYAVYDMTHSANILATTDLTSDTAYASCSYVFTTPAGCTSIKISFLGKANGDIVWFDNIRLCPTEYSETVTTGSSKTSVVKSDIPQKAAGILTVTINKSGTAAIGELIIGTKTTLGTMRPKPQIGFRNLSTLDEDTWGNISIVPRGYKNKMVCGVIVPSASLDSIYKFLCDHKDDMLVYVGSETYSCMQLYGFAKEPQIIPEVDKTNSDMSLEIWSVI